MGAPSNKVLNSWWDATIATYGADYHWTCADCGRVDKYGGGAIIQPQHPFSHAPLPDGRPAALCGDCIAVRHRQAKAERKAQLAVEPRCEVPGCLRRGAWICVRVLLCGAHLSKAKRGHHRTASALGGMALFLPMDFDRADVLRWAAMKGDPQ